MKLINCKRETFINAVGSAYDRGTKEERAKLRNPAGGLWPHGLFNYTENGRDIALCTWLMVLRADMRGKLALAKLAPWTVAEIEVAGRVIHKKFKPTKEAYAAALEKQHALIIQMMEACPGFFAGMIEEEEKAEVAA
jgi:hypothetical protein